MAKPTTLANMVAKQTNDAAKADLKEDEKLARKSAPAGKVWVRLVRPHYDAEGFFHEVGAALLNSDAVPSSAKVLTQAGAAEAEEGDDD